MRRTASILLAGGILLTATACATLDGPADEPVPTAQAAIKTTCEVLGRAYEKNMGPLAEALTAYVADRKTLPAAQKSLDTFAMAIHDATATSADAELKAAGQKTADSMHAKSTDTKFFATIKTTKDVDKTLGPTLSEWLTPVQSRCS